LIGATRLSVESFPTYSAPKVPDYFVI